jgi:hypothetical protein
LTRADEIEGEFGLLDTASLAKGPGVLQRRADEGEHRRRRPAGAQDYTYGDGHWNGDPGYAGLVDIHSPNNYDTKVTVPSDARTGQTIHVILQMPENGPHALTRYQRVVITIK